jgi:uncharacterized phage protein (TIGR02220 family)
VGTAGVTEEDARCELEPDNKRRRRSTGMKININTNLFFDERYEDLVDCFNEDVGDYVDPRVYATGVLVHAIKLALRFWVPDKKLIPHKTAERSKVPFKSLIECELAEKREDGIYVKGLEDAFSWYFESREAGRMGGLRSGEVRRAKAVKRTPPQGDLRSNEPTDTVIDTVTVTDTDTVKNSNVRQKKKRAAKKPEVLDPRVCRVIDCLNRKAGKDFRPGTYAKQILTAIETWGFGVSDLERVIEAKAEDPYFQSNPKYLRPQTLFGSRQKIESYLNEGRSLNKSEQRELNNRAIADRVLGVSR